MNLACGQLPRRYKSCRRRAGLAQRVRTRNRIQFKATVGDGLQRRRVGEISFEQSCPDYDGRQKIEWMPGGEVQCVQLGHLTSPVLVFVIYLAISLMYADR
jgi:hypothetical protein